MNYLLIIFPIATATALVTLAILDRFIKLLRLNSKSGRTPLGWVVRFAISVGMGPSALLLVHWSSWLAILVSAGLLVVEAVVFILVWGELERARNRPISADIPANSSQLTVPNGTDGLR